MGERPTETTKQGKMMDWIQKAREGPLSSDELGDLFVSGVVILGWIVVIALAIGGWI